MKPVVPLVLWLAACDGDPDAAADETTPPTVPSDPSPVPSETGSDTGAPTGETVDTGEPCPPVGTQRRLSGDLELAQVAWATQRGVVGSKFGHAVAAVGDVTGDDRPDLVALAYDEVFGTDEGAVHLLLSPIPAGDSHAGVSSARFVDGDPGAGYDEWYSHEYGSIHRLEDVSGDGIADLVLASMTHQPVDGDFLGWGTAYIVDTSAGALTATDLAVDPSHGWITGTDAGSFATATAVGDVDGDDIEDLLVSSPRKQYDDGGVRGEVYVYLGPILALETTQSSAKYTIYGDNPVPVTQGGPVTMGEHLLVGDVTSDGLNDVVVTSPYSVVDGTIAIGEVYVFEGPLTGDVPTSSAVGTLQGDSGVALDALGINAGWLGDTDGDGYEEFGLGSDGGGGAPYPVGHAFVIDGPVVGVSRAVDRADTQLHGALEGDVANHVTSAGDLDQDGLQDVAIGAYAVDGDDRGAVFLYYGALPSGSHVVTEAPDAVLWGEGGRPVAIAATDDIDGDCMPDLAVGAGLVDTVYTLRGGTL